MSALTEEEVRQRLSLWMPEKVIDELYVFGSMLLQECVERLHKIDSKAGTLAGFSGAILALIVSTFRSWSQNVGKFGVLLMFLAAIAVLAAGTFCICVMGIRTFDKWFSTNEWMHADCISNALTLRKYHILAMYGVIEEHEAVSTSKTKWLSWAQWSLAIAGYLLFIALAYAGWLSAGRELLSTFFNAARIAFG